MKGTKASLRHLFNLILYPPRMFEDEILELYSYMWTSNPESCWKKTYQLLPLVFSIIIYNCQLDTVHLLYRLPFCKKKHITQKSEDIAFYFTNRIYFITFIISKHSKRKVWVWQHFCTYLFPFVKNLHSILWLDCEIIFKTLNCTVHVCKE